MFQFITSYSECAGDTIATQSLSAGSRTPVIVTVTNSSSESLELVELTTIWRYGFGSEHSSNDLLFIVRKFDIAVWLANSASVLLSTRGEFWEEQLKILQRRKMIVKKILKNSNKTCCLMMKQRLMSNVTSYDQTTYRTKNLEYVL